MKRVLAVVGYGALGLAAGAGAAVVAGVALERWERSHLGRYDPLAPRPRNAHGLADVIAEQNAAFHVDVYEGMARLTPAQRAELVAAVGQQTQRELQDWAEDQRRRWRPPEPTLDGDDDDDLEDGEDGDLDDLDRTHDEP